MDPVPEVTQAETAAPARVDTLVLLARTYGVTVLVAVAVFVVAYENGGAGESTRDTLAIVLWWLVILGTGLGIWPIVRIPAAAFAAGGLLALFGFFTLLSTVWAADAAGAYAEFTRVALYVGVVAIVVLTTTRAGAGRWSDGLALGIVAIMVVALISRLFPGVFPESNVEINRFLSGGGSRLSFPLGYWNGLAIFGALAIPLLLRVAITARNVVVQGVALSPIPAVAGVIYLASSRGGAATAIICVAVFFLLVDRRWNTAAAALLAGLGSAGVVLALYQRNTLVNGPLGSGVAESQGRSAALIILGICALTGILYALGNALVPENLHPSRRLGWGLVAGAVVFVGVGIALSHPVRRVEQFKQPPTQQFEPGKAVEQHLLSGSGGGRWQFWTAAWKEFESRPFHGRGAGSYESWWAQHGSIAAFVKDAHSLYLEVLGELGIVGFLLLVGSLVTVFVAGGRRFLRARGDERVTLAALVAAFAGFVVAAAADWMWELTVVSVVAFVCVALLTGPATSLAPAPRLVEARESPPRSRLSRYGVVVAAILASWLLICAIAVQLLAGVKLGDSQDAAARGDPAAAIDDALLARSIQPWSSAPYLQVALVAEQAGRLRTAEAWIRRAISRDSLDWSLWLTKARIETKLGAVSEATRSLDRACELSPRSSVCVSRTPT